MTTEFQWVIDNAESVAMDRLKTVAQSTARDGTVKTVARTGQPWRFNVRLPDGPRWTDYRQHISKIEAQDRVTVGTVGFTDTGHDWLIQYQGDCDDYNSIRATWGVGNTITLISGQATSGYTFRAGDIIQLGDQGSVYTVADDVLASENTVTLHRPIIDDPGTVTLNVAEQCRWRMICTQFPSWTLFARDQVSWSGAFVFTEDVARQGDDYQSSRPKKQVDVLGGAELVYGIAQFQNYSIQLQTGDGLSIAGGKDFIFDGDFTVESWVNFGSITPGSPQTIFTNRQSSSYVPGDWYIQCNYVNTGEGKLQTGIKGINPVTPSEKIYANTWYHIALVRQSGQVTLYIDGVDNNATSPTNHRDPIGTGDSNTIIVGLLGSANQMTGYIDEIRVSKRARYSSDFVAPTEPFVNDSDTVLLIHGKVDSVGNKTIEDDNK